MKNQTKYTKNGRLKRNCEKCKNYGGMISEHYYLCTAEITESKTKIKCHDIYDIRIMKKGCCNLYIPKEIKDDNIHDHTTVERHIEEAAAALYLKE